MILLSNIFIVLGGLIAMLSAFFLAVLLVSDKENEQDRNIIANFFITAGFIGMMVLFIGIFLA